MGIECLYCEREMYPHSPVFVAELGREIELQDTLFCNPACLAAFIEEEGLADNLSCEAD